jgi:hypothetical protein
VRLARAPPETVSSFGDRLRALARAPLAELEPAVQRTVRVDVSVIEVAGRRRTAQYMGISATLAGVRGVIGPLLGALMIRTLGVHAVFLTAAASMTIGAWLVSRQLRVMARTELASVAHARVLG